MAQRPEHCALCERSLPLQFHHLIPRRNHRRKSYQRRFSLEEMRTRGIWVCRDCHRAIHRFFDEGQLGLVLNTLEALAATPELQRHAEWARRQRRVS
jgi:hypothetical protein|tara:strand:+ start:12053 stop:12343 length:291 start_codon:yes stop_codon:yes gene_type:complete